MKSYFFSITLLASIFLGALAGYVLGPSVVILKPLGDIFINLIFLTMIPLVFFNISASISQFAEVTKLLKVIYGATVIFLFTGLVAAIYMIGVVKLFPIDTSHLSSQSVHMPDLNLLVHINMLALIVFSFLFGFIPMLLGKNGKRLSRFLQTGAQVFMKLSSYIMLAAPLGFFAYFAVLVGKLGPQLLQNYFQVTVIYYSTAVLYFVFAFTAYAYLADKKNGIKVFWKNALLPTITALATCSSAASIPANLISSKKIGVQAYIYDTVIPLGTLVHKDGSVLGGILKIAFLFSFLHMNFSGMALFTATMIAVLVGTVMGAIPSGGMLGEMLILSFYGFPPQTLMLIAAISIIIDPLATMINVTGNCVSSMMIARLVDGRKWMTETLGRFAFVSEA